MSLKYEPSSEPLHISAKYLFLFFTGSTVQVSGLTHGVAESAVALVEGVLEGP